MPFNNTLVNNLNIVVLPQSKYEQMALDGLLDENALYLTESSLAGVRRDIAREPIVIPVESWTANATTGLYEATITHASIRPDTDVIIIIDNAQKGQYALDVYNPTVAGQTTAIINIVPDEAINATLVVTEAMEV